MPNSIVFSNPGASIIRWGDGVAAPYLTLSVNGSTTLVGAAVTGNVTNTGSASGQWSVASAPADVLVSPSSGTLAVNAFASFTLTALAAGAKVITLSSSTPGATIVGSPASLTVTSPAPPPPPPPPPSPAPTGNITQYLTSDGGSATYTNNFSGPTRDFWHRRMGFAWKRTNTLGNWLDASQVEEGSSAYGTSAAITAVDQVLVITANALVSRWLSTGQNRGAYLRVNSGSAFPVAFYGRTDATDANRPKLTVITSTGTFVLTAAANAYFYNSTFSANGAASEFRLSSGAAVAILRFDLSTVTGSFVGATLSIKVKSFPSGGSAGQVVGLYECDPPTISDPVTVASPVLGARDAFANFGAYKVSGAPILLADDFELGGPFDTGFSPSATRTLNTATNTTYARGTISTGANGSLDNNKSVSTGTGTGGAPNVVYDELFGQYSLYLESTFGTTQDDAIKIPAMGVQFGYWVPTGGGYWQQTTGNGGNVGTGLKKAAFTPANAAGNFEYEGHSVRFLTGTEPTALDDDPYTGWFGIGIYPYNLDQVGPNPAGEPFPWIAVKKESWYTFDIRVKQNTMTGAQDGLGNYATANADGIYQVWINGQQVYSKTNFRWRKHAEFGVQGLWLDVYHGGVTTAPRDMHYRVDRVSISTAYVGPPALALPSWVPAANNAVTYTSGGATYTNRLANVNTPYYDDFQFIHIADDSSAVTNEDLGDYGGICVFGGGHAGTNNNGVYGIVLKASTIECARLADASPYRSSTPGGDSGTVGDETSNSQSNIMSLLDTTWGDWDSGNGQPKPASNHTYGHNDIVTPTNGGATHGTFFSSCITAGPRSNGDNFDGTHYLDIVSLTDPTLNEWRRAGATIPRTSMVLPVFTAYSAAQNKSFLASRNNPSQTRVFDHAAQTWTSPGASPGIHFGLATDFYSGALVVVDERELLVQFERQGGDLVVRYESITGGVPGTVNTATLSATLTVGTAGSGRYWANCAFWCPITQKLWVGNAYNGGSIDNTALFEVEIPATLSNTWTVTRRVLTSGTIPWNTSGWGRIHYFPRIKCGLYMSGIGRVTDAADTITAFRLPGT